MRLTHSSPPRTDFLSKTKHRMAAWTVSTFFATSIVPTGASARRSESASDVGRISASLTLDAQRAYERGDYLRAARAYRQILDTLPESEVYQEERDNALILALEVYQETYAANGSMVSALCEASEMMTQYDESIRSAYGEDAQPSVSARASKAELDQSLETEARELGHDACAAQPPEPPPVIAPSPPVRSHVVDSIDPPRGSSGVGLIVGGAATLAGGFAASSMVIVGGIRRADAKDTIDSDTAPDAAKASARRDLQRADRLLIAGSITTGVLLVSGGAMLGVGIAKRRRYLAVAPTFRRGLVGLSLQGRF